MLAITFIVGSFGFSKAARIQTPGSPIPPLTAENFFGGLIILFSGFLFLSTIYLAVQAVITLYTTEFAITNLRIIAKKGLIRRHTIEMLITKIESVSVNQNIIGRLLNYGSVIVTGTGGTRESFNGIYDPLDVKKKIHEIIEYINRKKIISQEYLY
ncbi:MAG TPA: PH domain-containing protein [Anaerolineales bacterium]|nr:PH domain-containing protein [Anaerolineales bacterium]